MHKLINSAIALGFMGLMSMPVAAEGDPAKGKRLWARCKACHTLEEGKNRVGPTLHGVFGRTAGAVEGYKYSKAMAASGIVWSDETIGAYLKDPKGYVPKNKMAFVGLKKDDHIAHLLSYLHQELDGK